MNNKIKITPVDGKNGLYHIELENDKKSLSITEISKIIRKPLPKIKNYSKRYSGDLKQPFRIGEKIYDVLTEKTANVIGIQYSDGKTPDGNSVKTWSIWIDNIYLDGGRHPWEIEKYKEEK